jgi:hypothetical protein
MVGKDKGLVALIRKEAGVFETDQFMQYHCILHQENLCAKCMSFKDVIRETVNTVNFITSHELNHREFQQFLSEMEAEHGVVLNYTVKYPFATVPDVSLYSKY